MANKVYVGNLDQEVGEEDLRVVFSECGDIEEIDVIMDPNTGKSKGFAFITYVNEEDAAQAIAKTNEKDLKGKPMRVNEAKPREEK